MWLLSSGGWSWRPRKCQPRWFAICLHRAADVRLQEWAPVDSASSALTTSLYDGAGQGGHGRGNPRSRQILFFAEAQTEHASNRDRKGAENVCGQLVLSCTGRERNGTARRTDRRDSRESGAL